MAVEGASVAVAVQECAKLAQIGADPIGSNRGVLPSPPGIGLPGHMRGGTETGFANFPDLALLVGIAQQFHVRLATGLLQRLHALMRTAVSIVAFVAAEFDAPPTAALGQTFHPLRVRHGRESCREDGCET